MPKHINVTMADGRSLTPTYLRRAKQLVKTGRARWVDDEAICLLETPQREGFEMDYSNYASNGEHDGERNSERNCVQPEVTDAFPGIPDEEIYHLAKKRVRARKALYMHIVVYVAVNLYLATISLVGGEIWFIFPAGGWGIGLACHVASYFLADTPDAIQREYERYRGKIL